MISKLIDRYSLAELIIPLYVIISQYNFGNTGLNIGFIALAILTFFYLLREKKIVIFFPLFILVFYMFINDLIKSVDISMNAFLWFQYFVIILFLFLIKSKLDEEKMYRYWKYIGFFAVLCLFYQAYQVFIQGIDVGIIKVLPFNSSAETFSLTYNRPHSIFLEPALYSTWILPLLFMTLKRKKYIYAFIITLSIFLTTSTTGLIMSVVLWIYFLSLDYSIKFKFKAIILLMLSLLMIILFTSPIFDDTVTKFSNEDFNTSVRTSTGWRVYAQLDVTEKTFGIVSNDLRTFILNNIDLSLLGIDASASFLGYVNSLSFVAVMYGVVGLILYIYLFYYMMRKGKKDMLPYLLLCFISIFGQSVFFNSIFVMQFSILIGVNDFKKLKVRKDKDK